MVNINQECCCHCGLCQQVCPHRLFEMKDDKVLVDDDDCMYCGHCQSVCPTGAISVTGITDTLGLRQCEERTQSLVPGEYDAAGLVQLMRSRRSCRNYENRPVDITILEDLVRIGTTAPSGTNSQSWNFVILPERKDVVALGNLTADYYRKLNRQAQNPWYRVLAKMLAGDALGKYYRNYFETVRSALREWDEDNVDRLFHGAAAAILVTGQKDASCPAEDALLATQNILLAAHAMGLGSCLIGFVVEAARRDRKIGRIMDIPESENLFSVIALGYPDVKYKKVAGRRPVHPRIIHT